MSEPVMQPQPPAVTPSAPVAETSAPPREALSTEAAAPREPAAPAAAEPLRFSAEQLRRARAYLHYADAVLLSVDEPVEGGRDRTAAQLLWHTVETLTPGHTSDAPLWHRALTDTGVSAQTFAVLFDASRREQVTRDEAKAIRRVVWAAMETLAAPEVVQQTRRLMKLVGVALGLVVAVVVAVLGSRVINRISSNNLLTGKPFRTSTTLPGWQDGQGLNLIFHTENESSPWVEYDLGQPTSMHEVTLVNRQDCCDERAIPMAVEVSDDRTSWQKVAERREPFKKTTISFEPTTRRFLRLRVLRPSFLHLESVEAR